MWRLRVVNPYVNRFGTSGVDATTVTFGCGASWIIFSGRGGDGYFFIVYFA